MENKAKVLDRLTVECLRCGAKVEISIEEQGAEAQYNSFMARHPAFCRKGGEHDGRDKD